MPPETNLFVQYANVIIPLAVSLITGIATFFVYREKVNHLEKEVEKLRTEMKEIRDKAIACETSLKEREPLTKRKSPVVLTDRGNKVLTDSKGNEFIDTNYTELKKAVEATNPQNSYDIQEASRKVVEGLKDDQRINQVKEYLFKEGMEFNEIVEVLGIYLRDKILKEIRIP